MKSKKSLTTEQTFSSDWTVRTLSTCTTAFKLKSVRWFNKLIMISITACDKTCIRFPCGSCMINTLQSVLLVHQEFISCFPPLYLPVGLSWVPLFWTDKFSWLLHPVIFIIVFHQKIFNKAQRKVNKTFSKNFLTFPDFGEKFANLSSVFKIP